MKLNMPWSSVSTARPPGSSGALIITRARRQKRGSQLRIAGIHGPVQDGRAIRVRRVRVGPAREQRTRGRSIARLHGIEERA